jgi:hypothetical protein
MDTQGLVLGIAVLSALMGWAAWHSPKIKAGLGMWLIASADADEIRTDFFRERLRDLKAERNPVSFLDSLDLERIKQ